MICAPMVTGMDWREFVAALVSSLAWPGAVFAVALVFRSQIVQLLSTGLQRVKAGPFEAEWNLAEQRVPASLRVTTKGQPTSSADAEAAAISPRSAILERHSELVARLTEVVAPKLGKQPEGQSLGDLAHVAEREGLIDPKTNGAFVGLTAMRNLAAHGPGDIDAAKASEFIAIADATEYAILHGRWSREH